MEKSGKRFGRLPCNKDLGRKETYQGCVGCEEISIRKMFSILKGKCFFNCFDCETESRLIQF